MSKQAMKRGPNVEYLLPHAGVDGEVVAYDVTGRQIAAPHRVVWRPHFYRSAASVPVLFCRLYLADGLATPDEEQGGEVQRVTLALSGSVGQLRLVNRTRAVSPAFIAKLEAPKKPAKAFREEEDEPNGDAPHVISFKENT
jgi:hypothetical protein